MIAASQHALKVNSEIHAHEELIDTYDLFAEIFKESGGHYSFTPKLDITLPLIYGEKSTLRQLFSQFLSEHLNGKQWGGGNLVLISHTKNRLHWIFNFKMLHPIADSIPIQTLLIPKRSIQNSYSNAPYRTSAS
jgi:hypothetical protein